MLVCRIHFGWGTHEHYINDHELQLFRAYSWGEWIQTFLVSLSNPPHRRLSGLLRLFQTLTLTKVSICFFLLRLPVSKKYTRPLQVSILLLIVSNVALTLLWILHCIPVSAAWNPRVSGKCFSKKQQLDIILAQAIISIVSDFALALYPVLILRNLQTTLKRKVGICLLMGKTERSPSFPKIVSVPLASAWLTFELLFRPWCRNRWLQHRPHCAQRWCNPYRRNLWWNHKLVLADV